MHIEARLILKSFIPIGFISIAIPWLIYWLEPGNQSSLNLVNSILDSSSGSEANLKITGIYISAPVLVIMWPATIVYKICGRLHDTGVFAYYRHTISTAHRVLFRSITWSIFGSTLGAIVGLVMVSFSAHIAGKGSGVTTLFERLLVGDSLASDTIQQGFITTTIIAAANSALALIVTLWTRGIVAVATLFSTFIATAIFQDLPIFDLLSKATPVYYFGDFLSPVADGYVVDNWQTGRLLCIMWIFLVLILLLFASFRYPKLVEIG